MVKRRDPLDGYFCPTCQVDSRARGVSTLHQTTTQESLDIHDDAISSFSYHILYLVMLSDVETDRSNILVLL